MQAFQSVISITSYLIYVLKKGKADAIQNMQIINIDFVLVFNDDDTFWKVLNKQDHIFSVTAPQHYCGPVKHL